MARLAVDRFGQIYETSPDREDGGGYKCHPTAVSAGDLTLDAAYLKSQEKQKNEILQIRRDQKFLDAQDAAWEEQAKREKQLKARVELAQAEMLSKNSVIRDNILRRALQMGSNEFECEYAQDMTGNVFSANGQMGHKGMSRDQLAIHNALNPDKFHSNTAFGVDPVEAEQARHRIAANRILSRKAR